MIPRVIYDCMIYLQGAANSDGPAGACVRRAVLGEVELSTSLGILAEVRDVLSRPKTTKRYPQLTPKAINLYLKNVSRYANVIADPPKRITLLRDPKDEKYLNLAIAANAKFIVSRDNDLLDLMKPGNAEGEIFRAAYPTIAILEPVAFLATLPTV